MTDRSVKKEAVMAPKIVDKKIKSEQIIRAAIEIFGIKGFERTRMEDIAKEANVGKGTIYEYFADKDSLMKGSFDYLFASFAAQMAPEIDPSVSAAHTIREITHKMIEAMEEIGHTYRFFLEYLLYLSRRGDDYGQLETMLVEYRKLIGTIIDTGIERGEFRSDIDTAAAAASFAAWFDGAIFHLIVLPNIGLKEMADQFLEMTLFGLVKPSLHHRERRQ